MRIAWLFLGIVFLGLVSCKKEKSFEVDAPATGSLRNDATGDCLPKTAAGAFIAGTALSDSNYLEVEIDVATEGAYNIHTDTVNGYSFSAIGNFTQTGSNKIRLAATGTPTAAGENEFVVYFDTSFCFVPVTVLPAGSNSGPAAFTLQGNGDSCIVATVVGTYTQGVSLTGAQVSINVTVTTPGTYNISTNSMNGFQFAGSGILPAAGPQTITLIASGTPEMEGETVFTVTAGNTCSFKVNVLGADTQPPPDNTDLFPLTPNSYWTYDLIVLGSLLDTGLQRNAGTATINGQTYQAFIGEGTDEGDTTLYRKDGGNYYTFGSVNAYTQIALDTPQYAEMIFLKEGLNVGDTWNSETYTGTEDGKQMVFKYVYTCVSANTSLPVNGVTYNGVYAIKLKTEGTVDGAPYVPDGGDSETTFYYAKGIGLIQVTDQVSGATVTEIQIRHYKIN